MEKLTSIALVMFQDVADGNRTAPLGFLWFALAILLAITIGVWREWRRNRTGKK